ncbi:MAG TPA: NAD(P)H-dependent oxidoreductase [Vicinamibacterales bacterium]|nr:NAD(P)H-dependent oxidoreductase [Vicinamibacterales bacterium]
MQTVISVVLGSTRQGRFGEKPARWIHAQLAARPHVEARLLDLREFPMPFFDEPLSPRMPGRPPYENPAVTAWTRAVAESDGFVFIAAEYNHGPTAVLKNAMDWVYHEWNRKPVAFVGYGTVAGARSIEQLRQIAVELQLAPIQSAVHVPMATLMAHFQGGDVEAGLAELQTAADHMIDDLLWWTRALKNARHRPATLPEGDREVTAASVDE